MIKIYTRQNMTNNSSAADVSEENGMKTEEIKVKVPWGHIAGKAWGDSKNLHVLALHGLQDNAGSFDRLIPHLPTRYYYLCFDLPGHGRSSHLQSHFPLHAEDYVLSLSLIADHFGQDKYVIIGHSLGGQIGSLFARLYPQNVDKLILLDSPNHVPIPAKNYHAYLKRKIDIILQMNKKASTSKPQLYTYEEAYHKICSHRIYGKLTEQSAKILLQRGLIPTEDGKYQFTLDPRMSALINPLHDLRYSVAYFRNTPFQCNVLIILARDSEDHLACMKPLIDLFRENKRITIKYVPGNHDVHMNNPELVSEKIIPFLEKSNTNKL